MVTLQDLDTFVPNIIRQLDKVRVEATKYKRNDVDYRARVLVREIEEKIEQVKKMHAFYKTKPAISSVRKNDFTEWTNNLEKYLKSCREKWAKIQAFESSPYKYY